MPTNLTTIPVTKAKHELRNIDVEEIALVDNDHQPVHPGATIDIVKAQDTTPRGVIATAISLLKKALGDDADAEVEKAAAGTKTSKDDTSDDDGDENGDESKDDADGDEGAKDKKTGKDKGMKKAEDDAADAQQDDAENGNKDEEEENQEAPKSETKKAVEIDADDLYAIVNQLTEIAETVAGLQKANGGVAVASEARGHAASGSRDASDFVSALKTSVAALSASLNEVAKSAVDAVPAAASDAPEHSDDPLTKAAETDDTTSQPAAEEVAKSEETVEETTAAVVDVGDDRLSKALELLVQQTSAITDLATRLDDQATRFASFEQTIAATVDSRIRSVLNKAEAEIIEQARKNDLPPVVSQEPATLQKAVTRQDVAMGQISGYEATRRLLKTEQNVKSVL